MTSAEYGLNFAVTGYRLHEKIMKKKKVVVFGGGNGSATVIRALKKYTSDFSVSAVISMSDSGGSSGKLRKEFGVLPPGDVLRAVLASSIYGYKQVLKPLFYGRRFQDVGKLSDHNLGNLFLTFSDQYSGDFLYGIRALEQAVGATATVFPSTLKSNDLVVKLSNGETVKGEEEIDRPTYERSARIVKAWLEPVVPACEDALKHIREADLLLMGPGSFYCSVIPALLPTGIKEAIAESSANIVYIAGDIYELDGETGPTALSEFVHELEDYLPRKVDMVILNGTDLSETQREKYKERKWGLINFNKENLKEYQIIDESFELYQGGLDPAKLGAIFMDTFVEREKSNEEKSAIIKKIDERTTCVKFFKIIDGAEVGRARLVIVYNDLHEEPYGLLEDVFVERAHRSRGFGTELTKQVIEEAKRRGCYKLLAQSRYGREAVHKLYEKIGFKDHGKNFRMEF